MATADDVMHVNVLAGGDIGGRYPHGLSIFNDLAALGDSLDGDLMGKGKLVFGTNHLASHRKFASHSQGRGHDNGNVIFGVHHNNVFH